uniref:EF-hand domain-containing protein n=1 Tax=Nelumbo nucifera TaxID=4432 RepID=A0A822ZW46_NELNU|nr:TPA_asm: hypothetical protein HUJ06_019043 [Nelumbo nucifera]
MMNRFKKKALRVIADHLSFEEVEDIKEMFKKMDTDNDGIVSIEELKTGLPKFGSQLAEKMDTDTFQFTCFMWFIFLFFIC